MSNNGTIPYSNIKGMKELRNQRRLLASRIDHQEILIFYTLRTVKDNFTPFRIIYMGLEAVARRNPVMGVVFQIVNFARSFLSRRKK